MAESTGIFNEDSLRAAIVDRWGEYGAHVEVFDHMLGLARDAAKYRAALATVHRYDDGLRASNWDGLANVIKEALDG